MSSNVIKIIKNGKIVNEGHIQPCDIVIENDKIAAIENCAKSNKAEEIIDAKDCYIFPGVIDTHVHFREPGMIDTADIFSESRAAAAGGVTCYFDMPNNRPPTTSLEAINAKREIAKRSSAVNYSFYLGATTNNINEITSLDPRTVCGVKVFMGSSTGNMLVDDKNSLEEIFSMSPIPIVAHCEDMDIIKKNTNEVLERYGKEAGVEWHPYIRSEEACYKSSCLAVNLAKQTGAKLHVAHISTSKELELFEKENNNITAEACVPHLVFCDKDYAKLGAIIKCNPAIKKNSDRQALREALKNGKISTVATDHAPHPFNRKQGGAFTAASGMPSLQFSLINMLALFDQGVISLERIPELVSFNPAKIFNISKRGSIREKYFADLVIVKHCQEYTLKKEDIISKCGWSPYEGRKYSWRVEKTISNGECVYSRANGFLEKTQSREITFDR